MNQKMLHEKMMMDPAISLVLFNEYIPLQQPKKQNEVKSGEKELCREMDGLFLGQLEVEAEGEKVSEKVEGENKIIEKEVGSSGLFIRSELDTSGGLFIRSEEVDSTDDWIIA